MNRKTIGVFVLLYGLCGLVALYSFLEHRVAGIGVPPIIPDQIMVLFLPTILLLTPLLYFLEINAEILVVAFPFMMIGLGYYWLRKYGVIKSIKQVLHL